MTLCACPPDTKSCSCPTGDPESQLVIRGANEPLPPTGVTGPPQALFGLPIDAVWIAPRQRVEANPAEMRARLILRMREAPHIWPMPKRSRGNHCNSPCQGSDTQSGTFTYVYAGTTGATMYNFAADARYVAMVARLADTAGKNALAAAHAECALNELMSTGRAIPCRCKFTKAGKRTVTTSGQTETQETGGLLSYVPLVTWAGWDDPLSVRLTPSAGPMVSGSVNVSVTMSITGLCSFMGW